MDKEECYELRGCRGIQLHSIHGFHAVWSVVTKLNNSMLVDLRAFPAILNLTWEKLRCHGGFFFFPKEVDVE